MAEFLLVVEMEKFDDQYLYEVDRMITPKTRAHQWHRHA